MKQYVVDAFTDKPFGGSQAAVCFPHGWPSERMMRDIARENNFSETAFVVREGNAYRLRWFTPGGEIDFCGHATLAAAFVILDCREKGRAEVVFATRAGQLTVKRNGDLFEMDFPAYSLNGIEVSDRMEEAIGMRPLEACLDRDLLLVLPDAASVTGLKPDLRKLKELDGLLVAVTAPAGREGIDCASRVFAPKLDVPEDPVTGSTHCMIAPYWCKRLGKDSLTCLQASERGGILHATLRGNRVTIAGKAVLFSEGELFCERNPTDDRT